MTNLYWGIALFLWGSFSFQMGKLWMRRRYMARGVRKLGLWSGKPEY